MNQKRLTARRVLGNVTKALYAGETALPEGCSVDGVCDAILSDLDTLSDLAKQSGGRSVQRSYNAALLRSSSDDGDETPVGFYVGLGLGTDKLNLGFLMNAVIKKILTRFKIANLIPGSPGLDTVKTGSGVPISHFVVFSNAEASYVILHTYQTFILKRYKTGRG